MDKEGGPVTSTKSHPRDHDRNTQREGKPAVESDVAVEDDASTKGVTNDQQEQA